MKPKEYITRAALVFLLVGTAGVAGCFDTTTSRDMLYPSEDVEIVLVRGTIGEVKHDFTGPIYEGRIQIGAKETVQKVDNFNIGEGGGMLYVRSQVHFTPDNEQMVDFERYICVQLIYMPEDGEPEIRARERYEAPDTKRLDVVEVMAEISYPDPGLWSLRVEGDGTAYDSSGTYVYDWFIITVSGIYPDTSYNNNAPD